MKSFFAKFARGASSKVIVNGKSYVGRNVSIVNGKVFIDDVVLDAALTPHIQIQVFGDVERLETEQGDVSVSGSVGSASTVSGDLTCADVGGSVSTVSGDVTAHKIAGMVSTVSGDITA